MKKLIPYIVSLFIMFFFLSFIIILTTNFRQLYYFDIKYLNISEKTGMDKKEIIANYDTLIDYLNPGYKKDLNLPTLSMSPEGKSHFVDVKNIFIILYHVMYTSLTLSLIGAIYLYRKKNYFFYRLSAIYHFSLPLLLIIPLLIDFDRVFTLFHEIVFNNKNWLFYPETDPVITILPERFFLHSALLILLLVLAVGILLELLYRFHIKVYVKKLNSR